MTIWLWLPWFAVIAYLAARLRMPRSLVEDARPDEAPPVSVVVPARNEEHNIARCVGSLAASDYPNFEIIVVDDRSDDRTAQVARSVETGNAARIVVIEGAELPEGWLGKPWACEQGGREARGELILFTDADTVHEPELLGRAVASLREDGAGALSVVGRQLTESFWERLIQPHVFSGLLLRYPDMRNPLPPRRWMDAIANGQFILFTRESYEGVGRHEAVQAEVVEDLRMGQLLVKGGHRLSIRLAEDAFATRMYRSLDEIIEGWSKNVAMASRMSVPPKVAKISLPVTIVAILFYWIVPPLLAALGAAGIVSPALGNWGVGVTLFSVLLWAVINWRFRVPLVYALIYPLGTLASCLIFTRSLLRGTRVRWKGRDYVVESPG